MRLLHFGIVVFVGLVILLFVGAIPTGPVTLHLVGR
jgi:hypothetical protein